nr:MAG TPA: hypothetical protein [Caudoviricetes sp.]
MGCVFNAYGFRHRLRINKPLWGFFLISFLVLSLLKSLNSLSFSCLAIL